MAARSRLARLLVAAFLAGGILLGLEVVWFRFLALFVFGTELAFALMLATVLAGIALGGLVAAAWLRRRAEAARALAILALLAGVVTVTTYAGFEPAHAACGGRGGPDALALAGADAADVARLRRAVHLAGRRRSGGGRGRRRGGGLADAREHRGGGARRAGRRAPAASRCLSVNYQGTLRELMMPELALIFRKVMFEHAPLTPAETTQILVYFNLTLAPVRDAFHAVSDGLVDARLLEDMSRMSAGTSPRLCSRASGGACSAPASSARLRRLRERPLRKTPPRPSRRAPHPRRA